LDPFCLLSPALPTVSPCPFLPSHRHPEASQYLHVHIEELTIKAQAGDGRQKDEGAIQPGRPGTAATCKQRE
jgi:hypothetical protein